MAGNKFFIRAYSKNLLIGAAKSFFIFFFILLSAAVYSEVKAQEIKPTQLEAPDPAGKAQPAEDLPPKLYLLDRLKNLNRTLPDDYAGKTALKLRTAHVLGLLAEENFIKSKDESCSRCFAQAQRQAEKSLSLYRKLSAVISHKDQSPLQTEMTFQKAYLERLLGNKQKALAQLKKITAKDNLKADWGIRSWYGIGEIEFELYNYKKALRAFDEVLKELEKLNKFQQRQIKTVAGRGEFKTVPLKTGALDDERLQSWRFKAAYHKIWSLFNLSSYEPALNEMLALISSALYKNSSFDFWLDKENQKLRSKLEKEMITIYSYADITNENLKILYDFSKQKGEDNTLAQRKKRLSHLAALLTKMGRLEESNKVWGFYLSKDNSKEEELKAYFAVFSNKLKLKYKNKLEELGPLVKTIFALQAQLFPQKISASFNNAVNLKAKEFFYQLDSAKSSLSAKQKAELLSLYQTYNRQNPSDKDILLLSAMLAEELKKYQLAAGLFQQAVLYIERINKIKDLKAPQKAEWKEKLSVRQMELAELSKDNKTRLQAYDFYIQQGRAAALKHKAWYQTAYLHHQAQEFLKSQPVFLKLALNEFNFNEKAENELRLKSAHLYLSSLTAQKGREEELIRFAGLFKKEFPKERAEFAKIYNLAVLNYAAKLVQNKNFEAAPLFPSQDPSVQKAWAVLELFDSKAADKKNLEIYHLNRMTLAKQLLKTDEMSRNLAFLISDKYVDAKNKERAEKERIWLAEIKLDFDRLLSLLKQLQPEDVSKEHSLRLIQIAELSNQSPAPYYKDFLNRFALTPPLKQAEPVENGALRAILASLLKLSGKAKQKQLLKTYSIMFKQNPDELLYWILRADQGEMDLAFLNFFATDPLQKNLLPDNSFLSLFLKRKQSLESFEKALSFKKTDPKKAAGSRIAKAIKSYSGRLLQLEKIALSFLETEDWTTQVFVTGGWMRELKDFYNFVFELPFPKGLTKEEQLDYKNLLVQQMKVYADKITELEKKQKQLFSHRFLADYQKALESSVFHPYLKWEMSWIAGLLNEKDQKEMQSLLGEIETRSSLSKKTLRTEAELEKINLEGLKIYKKLESRPFDIKKLKAVLDIEKQRNNTARVRYLSNRIQQLESSSYSQNNKAENLLKRGG